MLERTVALTRNFIDLYGLHNTDLFKLLRRDRLTSQEKSAGMRNGPTFYAYSKSGFDYGRIDWGEIDWVGELDVAPIAPQRLRIRNDRGAAAQDNSAAFATVVALLNVFDDIKPFAHLAVRRGCCEIERAYDLRLAPLLNLDGAGAELARQLFPGDFLEAPYPRLSAEYVRLVREIFRKDGDEKALLAAHTVAVLKHWTDYSLAELAAPDAGPIIDGRNAIGFAQAMKRVLELLYRRYPAVTNADRRARMREALNDALLLYLRLSVLALLDGGYGVGADRLSPAAAVPLLSDEVLGTAASRLHEVFRQFPDRSPLAALPNYPLVGDMLEEREALFLRYRFYRKKFIRLGDEYGDCSAALPSSQVDVHVKNIHWTVYPWLLNPYYRVLEVCRRDGKGLIKAHITPLIVDGRRVLMVDAIETIPALRREAFARRGGTTGADGEAQRFNEAFYRENAEPAFFLLMERCVALGREMGVDAVYADMFSNAVWVRELLEKNYPQDSYHVANVEVPFSNYEVDDNICLIGEGIGLSATARPPKMEIQALNCGLMHQGARPNHKIVAVLYGLRPDWSRKIQAI